MLKYKEALSKYYDSHTGRFLIPVKEADYDISKSIITLISSGEYAMSVYDYGEGLEYCIFSLVNDCESYAMGVKVCRNQLYDYLHEKGVHYFTSMEYSEYSSRSDYADAVDYVLLKSGDNYIDGHSLCLIADDVGFKFIEVFDACV